MGEIIKQSGFFDSTDGIHKIAFYIIKPAKECRAVLQFCHGMAEHGQRYEKFGEFLAENGICFCICDHLGHGKSVNSEDELGYFGNKNGFKFLVNDAAKFTHLMKKEYEDLPYYIGGHSMGSFVVRAYLSLHAGLVDGGIIMGTGNISPLTALGAPVANLVGLFKGEQHRSKQLDKISFGNYNKSVENAVTPSDWLSRDAKAVQEYINDPLCDFIFSARAFADVSNLIRFVSGKKWALSLKKDCPLLLISGDRDPVGEHGKAVVRVCELLKGVGVIDVSIKLYEGARHEILNETNREEVYLDLLNWLNCHINKIK